MKHEMKYWLKYVTYQPQIAYINNTTMSVTNSGNTDHDNQRFGLSEEEMIKNSKKVLTVVPFELMLREMKYHHTQFLKDETSKKLKKDETKEMVLKNTKNDKNNNNKSKNKNTENLPTNHISLKGSSLAAMKSFNTKTDLVNNDIGDNYCYNPLSCKSRVASLSVKSLNLNETRTHLCAHKSRLMGRYKIVYFMQCVRILWPLTPGVLKSIDSQPGALSANDLIFIKTFHNVSKNTTSEWYGSWVTYPPARTIEVGSRKGTTILKFPPLSS